MPTDDLPRDVRTTWEVTTSTSKHKHKVRKTLFTYNQKMLGVSKNNYFLTVLLSLCKPPSLHTGF
jgi:hypothetical protein